MTENQLIKLVVILTAKRSVRPSLEDNKRLQEVLNQLYELTGNEEYKL